MKEMRGVPTFDLVLSPMTRRAGVTTGALFSVSKTWAGRTGEGVIGTQVVPGAYRVCAPAKCVWVEATRYCPPSTGCGGLTVLGPWPGGYCSPSVGCVTMNGRQYKVSNYSTYNNQDADAVVRCAVGLGLIAANAWTRGWSQRALLGAGMTTWGCGDLAG